MFSKSIARLYFRFLQNSTVTMSQLLNHLVRGDYIDLVVNEKNEVRWIGKTKMNTDKILEEICREKQN